MTLNQQLAEALRLALPHLGTNEPGEGFVVTAHQQAGIAARAALAAYDAQPAPPENGNAIALIEACAELHRKNHPLTSAQEAELPVRTRVLINLEGGLVQCVLADRELVDAIVIDYDTDGADDDEITEIPQDDGSTAEAIARIEVAVVDPEFIYRAFDAINQEP